MSHDSTNLKTEPKSMHYESSNYIKPYQKAVRRKYLESKIFPVEKLVELQKENEELTAIFVASVKTAKKNRAA